MSDSQYKREWYLKNRGRILERQKVTNDRVRKQKQDYIRNLKGSTPCADCNINYPYYVMDFDHVRGVKIANIADMFGSKRASWKTLLAEIEKCDLVCSNCHRIRTWTRTNQPSNG